MLLLLTIQVQGSLMLNYHDRQVGWKPLGYVGPARLWQGRACPNKTNLNPNPNFSMDYSVP